MINNEGCYNYLEYLDKHICNTTLIDCLKNKNLVF